MENSEILHIFVSMEIEFKEKDGIYYGFQPKFSNNAIECWIIQDPENNRRKYYNAQYISLEEAIERFKNEGNQTKS